MVAIPLSIIKYDFNLLQTLFFSVVGGVAAILIFSFFSDKVLTFFNDKVLSIFKKNAKPVKKKKRSATKILAIKAARKYGLFGIAFITPIFLSIPIGTLLALQFFPNKKRTIPILITSVVGWSLVLSFALTVL